MPILEEVGEATRVQVSASAPLELMWILHNLQAKHVLNSPYASLKRLREDRALRGKYRSLLLSAWEPLRAEWEASGRRAAGDAAIEWARMLEEGAGYRTLLDRPHVWPGRPE